jgi:hypothetical protein
MRTKLYLLCLLAALCFPLMAYCQYYDDVEIVEEVVTEDWDPLQKTRDSLRELSMDYYKDLSHWDIFIEPSVVAQEDTAFDPAGMKHAYFVRRFYFIAVPHASDFQYQPSVVGPHLYAYGQKMPMEARDAQQLQMIRNVVFPFAADFPANTPSRTIFQQYVEKNFDQDYHYVVDSLMAWRVSHLDKYTFQDTAFRQKKSNIEESTARDLITVFSCLAKEYTEAIPHPTVIEAPTREPIDSPKTLEQFKKIAVKRQNNIYILPQNTILNQVAHELLDAYRYSYPNYNYENVIAEMGISRIEAEEDDDGTLIYTDAAVSVSGRTYHLLNDHALFLMSETYYNDDDYGYSDYFALYEALTGTKDSVIILSPGLIETMTLAECYQRSLKDTVNCTCPTRFPPVLKVYVDDEIFDYDYYNDCKECYTKSAILERLNEGSVLYDYFEKDFYKNDLASTDSKSIGYYPNAYRYLGYDDEYDDVESNGEETIYLSKEQSHKIRKLLAKRKRLINQGISLLMRGYKEELATPIPKGQLHLTQSFGGCGGWSIKGKNDPYEATYDDEPVVIEVDKVNDRNNSKNKFEKKMERLENKINEIDSKMRQINEEIEKIAGHHITFGIL